MNHAKPKVFLVLRLLPALFVIFVAVSIAIGIRALAQPPGKETSPAATNAEASSKSAHAAQPGDSQNDNDPVKDLQRKIDELKWILGVILGAAGLFTIAQGAAAFFTAQTFVKQADDAVKRVQEIAADAERRFPVFSKAEEARRDAYRALAATFYGEGLDWRDTLYEQMNVTDRQRLISVERFVGLEFIGWAEGDPDFPMNLRRLANFYASKYVSDERVHRGDLERSEYYLHLARKVTNDQFWILNDLGVLFLELYHPKRLREARELFSRSYEQNPRQQRPLYNLAVMATYEQPQNWVEAARLLENALQEKMWERTETPEMTGNVHYNLACARARLNQMDECLAALENAARIGWVKKKTVDDDADLPAGDLYSVATHASPAIQSRFEGLRRDLSGNVNSRRNSSMALSAGWTDRVRRAWHVLFGKS